MVTDQLRFPIASEHMAAMVEKIDAAIEMLNDLEREYEARERGLLHPVKSRLRGAISSRQAR